MSKVVWLCTCGSEFYVVPATEKGLTGPVKHCPICGKEELIGVSDDEYIKAMGDVMDKVIDKLFGM